MQQIAILSEQRDLHALLVQRALTTEMDLRCHVIAVDRICGATPVSWSNDPEGFAGTIESVDGDRLAPRDLSLIWWRRLNPPQIVPAELDEPAHVRLINADCHATVLGLFLNEFRGVWVNDIRATRAAENKLVQLQAAAAAGIAVPRTLVSNDPSVVRRFCQALDHQVIIKAVRGAQGCHLFTRQVAELHLSSDESIRLSPAIYQEMIPGTRHLRIHCFGESVHAVEIESAAVDWREDIDIPFHAVHIDSHLQDQLRDALARLGLRMGIVDMKLRPSGTPVWLEVNPQGQYLFTEGLAGLDLTGHLAKFLASESRGRDG
jgi:glutathione synthase/RimK-type ligase-like ATP-grasp enzyme